MEEEKIIPKVPLIKFTGTMKPQEIADSIILGINEGNLNPLEVAVGFKKLQAVVDKVFDSKKGNQLCREARDTETQLHAPKGKAIAFNAQVQYSATKTSYDYAECANPKWAKLSRIKKQIEAEMKALQKEMLICPEDGKEITIDEIPILTWEPSGELVTVYPPIKEQSFGTKITL